MRTIFPASFDDDHRVRRRLKQFTKGDDFSSLHSKLLRERFESLSPREREVVSMVVSGMLNMTRSFAMSRMHHLNRNGYQALATVG
jgi:hypothetical protein